MIKENRIHLLPPAIAERIAAGEVIERPSSVVKELVENSLDAEATEILVALEEGGKSLIEVIDNGHGMSFDDLALSIERHATSKLSTLEDLDRILTLGFRGEALPSVAAVAEVSILSRTQDAECAYELTAGDVAVRFQNRPIPQRVTFGHFNNTPHGTRIQVRGLFSQIPARLKFLKSQAAEVSQVREWMERLAFAYPHVGFRLLSDGRPILTLRPQTERERVREILSDGEEYPIILVENDQDGFRDRGFKVRLYWLQGLSSPQNRRLVQVVNRRALRDRLLQQALLSPFRQVLLPGQFPALALFIEINPAAIDVNVHPTKAEIRFLENRKLFQSLDGLVRKMITDQGAPAIASWPSQSGYQSNTAPMGSPLSFYSSSDSFGSFGSSSGSNSASNSEPMSSSTLSYPNYEARDYSAPFHQPHQTESYQTPPSHPLMSARPLGILFQTYLAYEANSEMILVDQHAAHERVRYEKLRLRFTGHQNAPQLSSQALLLPEVVKFRPEERSLLESRLPTLEPLGFESEIFGENTLLFRSIPIEWGNRNLPLRLKGLVDRLLSFEPQGNGNQNEALLFDETLFESLASEACHSAVRAGDSLDPIEAKNLIEDLFSCDHPWNCPHGRPTVVKVHEKKFEEWFQRKV